MTIHCELVVVVVSSGYECSRSCDVYATAHSEFPNALLNSRFRSFRRTRLQQGRHSNVELEDNIFPDGYAATSFPLVLRIRHQRYTRIYGSWVRVSCQSPRVRQCGEYL